MTILGAVASDDHGMGEFGAGTAGLAVDAFGIKLRTREEKTSFKGMTGYIKSRSMGTFAS